MTQNDTGDIIRGQIGDSLNLAVRKTGGNFTGDVEFDQNAFHIDSLQADSAYVTANTINDTGDVIRGQIGDSLNLAVRKTGGAFAGDVEFDQNAFHIDSTQADSAYVTANTINDTADVLRGLISGDTLIFNESPSAAGTEFSIVQNMVKVRPGVGFSLSREDSTSFDLMRLAVDTATLNTNWEIATAALAAVATSANGIKTVSVTNTPTGAGDDQKVLTYFNTGDTLGWTVPAGGAGSEDSLIFNESESATGTEYAIMSNLIKRRPGVGIDFVREDSTTFDLLRTSVDTAFLNANWEIATAALAAVATSANGIKTVSVTNTPTGAGDDQKVLTYFNTGDTLGWTAPAGGSGLWVKTAGFATDSGYVLFSQDTLIKIVGSNDSTFITPADNTVLVLGDIGLAATDSMLVYDYIFFGDDATHLDSALFDSIVNGVGRFEEPAFGSMWVLDTVVGSSAPLDTLDIATLGVYFGINDTSTTAVRKGEIKNIEIDTAHDFARFIVLDSGTYEVVLNVSFGGSISALVRAAAFKNSVADSALRFTRQLSASGDVGSAGFHGNMILDVDDTVDVRFTSDGNGDNIYIGSLNFKIQQLK